MKRSRKSIPDWSRSLANARRRAGLTQEELALLLGISARTYSDWERGKSLPPPATEALTQEGVLATAERLAETRPRQVSPEVAPRR